MQLYLLLLQPFNNYKDDDDEIKMYYPILLDKLGTKLSAALDSAMAGLGTEKKSESYDFAVDFK